MCIQRKTCQVQRTLESSLGPHKFLEMTKVCVLCAGGRTVFWHYMLFSLSLIFHFPGHVVSCAFDFPHRWSLQTPSSSSSLFPWDPFKDPPTISFFLKMNLAPPPSTPNSLLTKKRKITKNVASNFLYFISFQCIF